MKCIILAAGYATRLYPLTLNTPKPLLNIAGKPMIEHILDKINEVEGINEIFIVTNDVFYPAFYEWRANFVGENEDQFPINIRVINDCTTSNENRLGAIGDVLFVMDKVQFEDDLMVIAGDNLFEFSLAEFMDVYSAHKTPVLAVYDVGSIEDAKKFGVVEIDEHGRLIKFVEKPANPKSSLIATACYFYPKNAIKKIYEYIEEGNAPDKPGSLIEWLYKKTPVHCYVAKESWFDIGSHESLKEADEYYNQKKQEKQQKKEQETERINEQEMQQIREQERQQTNEQKTQQGDRTRILVTGGAGFIGRWVVKKLLDTGAEVYVLDDLSNSSAENLAEFKDNPLFKGLKIGSIVNRSTVEEMFNKGIDICCHLAAQINVQESIDNPEKAYSVNILGTYNILEEARKRNTKVVLIGTCMVYDIADAKKPINEEHPIKPKSPYAGSKVGAESLAEAYYHAFGLPVVILRPFNTYGPFQKSNMEGGVVSIFVRNHLEGKPLSVFGNGTQTRDLLYVEDCAEFIVKAMFDDNAVGHVMNAGTGEDIAIKDLALLVCKDESKVKFVPHHHPQAEIPKLVCDYTKARTMLGWSPRTRLPEGINKTAEWIKTEIEKEKSKKSKMPMKKKILITGATGLLGPFLMEKFSEEYNVTGAYLNNPLEEDYDLVRADLGDEKSAADLIKKTMPDIIIHAAALTNLELCEQNPELAHRINVGATKNIINSCKAAGINPYIIYISTDYVFDGFHGSYTEDNTPRPINVYSETKLLAENIVQNSIFPNLVVRTAFYGWSRTKNKNTFSEWIINNLRLGETLSITADQHTSMMLIDDFVAVLAELVAKRTTGLYHVCSRDRFSRHEFAIKTAEIFGLNKALIRPVTYEELITMLPNKAKRPIDVSLNVSKIEKHLGKKMPALHESLMQLKKLENEKIRKKFLSS